MRRQIGYLPYCVCWVMIGESQSEEVETASGLYKLSRVSLDYSGKVTSASLLLKAR